MMYGKISSGLTYIQLESQKRRKKRNTKIFEEIMVKFFSKIDF